MATTNFLGLNLNNLHNWIFDNISLVYDNNVIDIFDLFALKKDVIDVIGGLPPDTLNTLKEIADALNNDPQFFQYVRNQLALKRDITDSYSKSHVDTLIALYYTKDEMDVLLNQTLYASVIFDYYNKTYIDNKFTNYYTKSGTNAAITAEINNLEELIAGIDLTKYYTQLQIDSKFINYYNKTETDSLLNLKLSAAASNTYYNKTYINDIFLLLNKNRS